MNATLRGPKRLISPRRLAGLSAGIAAALLLVPGPRQIGAPAQAQDTNAAGWIGSLDPLPPIGGRPDATAPPAIGAGGSNLSSGFDPLPPLTAARPSTATTRPGAPTSGPNQSSLAGPAASAPEAPRPSRPQPIAAAPPATGPAATGPAATGPASGRISVLAPAPSAAPAITTIPGPTRRAPAAVTPGAPAGAASPVPRARPNTNAGPAPASVPREHLSEGVYRQGNRIVATVGRVVEIEVDSTIESIFIGDGEVVSELRAAPRTVYLVGLKPGRTNVFLRGTNGRVLERYDMIIEADLAALREALSAVVPGSRIDVTATQSGVILNGQVRSAVDASNAASVAKQFVGGEGAVINAINIAGDQQVLLRVRVAEMNRSARKFLEGSAARGGYAEDEDSGDLIAGFTKEVVDPDLSTLIEGVSLGLGAYSPLASGNPLGTIALNQAGFDEIAFESLEERGFARLLAEPSLTAISGETANFLVGGEFPIATGVDEDGNRTFEFKEFGVKLSFTPVVLSRQQISLRINTEVSRLDQEASDILGVPGLSTRRAESTVMLPSGGSLMIAGLLQSEDRNTLNGVPGLMDLPVLGALFRSQDFQNDRSEMVVTVEAFTVRPRQMGAELALPTDGFKPADDFDMYVLGRLYDRYGGIGGGAPVMTVDAPFGYIME